MSWRRPIFYREGKTWSLWAVGIIITIANILMLINVLSSIMVLPQIQGDVAVGYAASRWISRIVRIFSGIAVVIPLKFANLYGTKRVLFISVALLVVAALFCAYTDTYWPLLIGRAVSGIGCAGIFGLGLVELVQEVPDRWRPLSVSGFSTATLGLGIGLGLFLGGVIAQTNRWHDVFWLEVWIGLPLLLAIGLFHPESERRPVRKFHVMGYLWFVVGVVSILLILTQAKAEWNTLGFRSPFLVTMIILGICGTVLFITSSIANDEPIYDLSFFREPRFLVGWLGTFVVGLQVFGITFVTVGMLQEVFGYEPLQVAYLLAPIGIVYFLFGSVPMLLSRWVPMTWWVIPGLGLIGLANVMSQWITVQADHFQLLRVILTRAMGVGLVGGPLTVMALSYFPKEVVQRGSAIISSTRMIAGIFGSGFVGMVVKLRTPLHVQRFGSQIIPYSPRVEEYTTHFGDRTPQMLMENVYLQASQQALVDAIYILGWLTFGAVALVIGLFTWEKVRDWIRVRRLLSQSP